MKNRIKLTESELHNLIAESVKEVLAESAEMDEGWLGDKWNQAKSAARTAFNGEGGVGNRLSQAKKNWNTQGDLNNINSLRQQLEQLLDAKQISPDTTVGQLVGGKYNNNRFGTMSGMAANRRGQIQRRGGVAY